MKTRTIGAITGTAKSLEHESLSESTSISDEDWDCDSFICNCDTESCECDLRSEQSTLPEMEEIDQEFLSSLPEHYRETYIKNKESLHEMKHNNTLEYMKYKQYIDLFERIPFGKYSEMPFQKLTEHSERCEFLDKTRKELDDKIYGHQSTKKELVKLVAKWMSTNQDSGCVIGLHGAAGVGKTKLLKEVFGPILERPVYYTSLAGISDGGFLDGYDYCYEGSSCGRIIDAVIRSKCMNPVIFFDELDKVSKTRIGAEIIGKLINITDPMQNSELMDKYFKGINFDLSKAIFVFSFNDSSQIDPILLNRIKVINVPNYDYSDKVAIMDKFLLPSVCNEYAIDPSNIQFSQEAIQMIIRQSEDPGVRYIRRVLETIIGNLNVMRYSSKCKIDFTKTIKINKETLLKLL